MDNKLPRGNAIALLKAFLVTAGVGLVLFGLLLTWRQKAQPVANLQNIQRLDSLESEGVPDREFQIFNSDRRVRLSDFKNKIVILNFWASWCAPCVEEIPSFFKLISSFEGKVVLIAVSADQSQSDLHTFLRSFPLDNKPNIFLVHDVKQDLMNTFGSEILPESFVIGKDQKLKKKIVGSINWYTPDSKAYLQELLDQ